MEQASKQNTATIQEGSKGRRLGESKKINASPKTGMLMLTPSTLPLLGAREVKQGPPTGWTVLYYRATTSSQSPASKRTN